MPSELTEEEMHRALFGGAQASAPVEVHVQTVSDGIPNLAKVVPIQELRGLEQNRAPAGAQE